MKKNLEFYAVRNKEGKWFHKKGYGGYGDTWVEDLMKARIYNRIGGARTQVTYFGENYSEYGVPDIVVFNVIESHVINEEKRLKDKAEAEEKRERKRKVKEAAEKLQKAQEEYDKVT